MPDQKISELTQDSTPATTDQIAVERSGSSNFRCTLAEVGTAIGATSTPADNVFRVVGSGDSTKRLAFEVDGITTATTRTITVPDSDLDLGKMVTSAAVITDNRIIRGDGGARGAQESAVTLDDSGNLTGLGTLNSHPIPGVGASAETGTTRSASSTDDNKVTQCSNAAGCTVSVNAGTAAGTWRAYWASTAGQQVTLAKGTLTTLYIAPTYNLGSDTCASLEEECVVGVYYLSTSVGIAFGIMAAA